MASNNPDLLQVSTCGINHAHHTSSARSAPAETHRGRGIHVPLWKATSSTTRPKKTFRTNWTQVENEHKQTRSAREVETSYIRIVHYNEPFIIRKIILWFAPINFRSLVNRNYLFLPTICFRERKKYMHEHLYYKTTHIFSSSQLKYS